MVSASSQPPVATATVAIVGGRVVRQGDLLPILLEIGGVEALTEVILDQALEAEAQRRGVAIEQDAIDRERALLAASLSPDPDTSLRMLHALRAGRGLGPVRFAALLRRNALLRAMVTGEVVIDDATIAAQFDLLHGERRQARIMTVAGLDDLQRVSERLARGESFADVAIELSTDVSAARGGLLQPISRSDSAYPEALRQALWQLEPGGVSDAIMLEGSLAVLALEREIPASGTELGDVRGEIEALARQSQERVLMERLAQQLIQQASVTILDAELDRRWEESRRSP